MITKQFQNREDWLLARKGKITGSRLKDLIVKRGTGEKKGFYELIAERIAIDPGEENPMERGQRLESEAIDRFIKETGKVVDTSLLMWFREDNESIAISPDGVIGDTEAVEVKCLSSASHIEAFLTNKIPSDYEYQAIQYFIVNEKLKKLYFVFYDPRVPCKDYFVIEINRKDLEDDIKFCLDSEIDKMNRIEEIVNKLTNF